ncbi:MAG: DUF3313 family protein [Halioglobus sp.]
MKVNVHTTQLRTIARSAMLVATVFVLAACASTPNEDLPEVTDEGLELVKGTKTSALYVLPGADLAEFNRLAIIDVDVAFRKNWRRDQNQDARRLSNKVSQEEADDIKRAVADDFERIFTEELTEAGYKVVDYEGANNSAQDLLVLRPAIVNLDVSAPDTMSPGRSRTFTTSMGSMTLYMEFYDAVSSSLLGRVVDAETAPDLGSMQISNSVTNKADADRILRKWARILVGKLDAAHGK